MGINNIVACICERRAANLVCVCVWVNVVDIFAYCVVGKLE